MSNEWIVVFVAIFGVLIAFAIASGQSEEIRFWLEQEKKEKERSDE